MPYKGARRATAQELHGAPFSMGTKGKGLVKLRDRRRLASLTAGCGLLERTCFDQKHFYPLPPIKHGLGTLSTMKERNSFIRHFPLP
jgi:hypothetical protein